MTPIEIAAILAGTFVASVALGACARSAHTVYELWATAPHDDLEGGDGQ